VSNLLLDLRSLLESSNAGISPAGLAALAFLALAALLFAIALVKMSGTFRVSLRPLRGYEQMLEAIGEAAESGQAIHLSAGSGSVGAAATVDTLAGVNAVAALVAKAATSQVATVITTASAVVLPLLQAASEQAYSKAGASAEYDPARVRFAGDDRNVYAVSVCDVLLHEPVGTSLLLGSLGEETLLIGERGQMAGVVQVTGTANTRALPYAIATADHVLLGEEIYAAGAYLTGQASHLASLLVQDWLRLIVVGAILAGVIAKTAGW